MGGNWTTMDKECPDLGGWAVLTRLPDTCGPQPKALLSPCYPGAPRQGTPSAGAPGLHGRGSMAGGSVLSTRTGRKPRFWARSRQPGDVSIRGPGGARRSTRGCERALSSVE